MFTRLHPLVVVVNPGLILYSSLFFQDVLLDKIDHVKSQYEEACKIKEVNDKRGQVVSGFLENYFDEDEFADFQYYIDMKTQLALMHAEIKDKVKMGEERLNTLTSTAIDWNTTSFCNY